MPTQSTCLIPVRGIGHRVTTCRECAHHHWTHRVKPRRGGLLIFYNFFADGHMRGAQDDYSLHLGCEVRGGEKVRLRILHPLICVVSAFVCAALDLVNNICSPVISFSASFPSQTAANYWCTSVGSPTKRESSSTSSDCVSVRALTPSPLSPPPHVAAGYNQPLGPSWNYPWQP